MRCALIGERLKHSFSADIHKRIGSYSYELLELPRYSLGSFMEARDFDGLNVTIPYKQSVIPYLDKLSPGAEAIGAVNTVVKRDGLLIGYNTDVDGLKMLALRMNADPAGKKVLIAGSGGTSLTAFRAMTEMGAREIYRISRSDAKDTISYEEAYERHKDADLIINATPVGMYPDADACPLDIERFESAKDLIDVIYNPLRTRLAQNAVKAGINAENGLYMLVAQAVLASELFTGRAEDAETNAGKAQNAETGEIIEDIYRDIYLEKSNIVLAGMPGSGKSTVSDIISHKLGRAIISTDDLIEERAGMPITEIFEKYGEEYFRDLESEVITESRFEQGRIISLGGGAVLRSSNIESIAMNGRIVFLDRDPGEIEPDMKRPLADSEKKIRKLYEERYPIYESTADICIKMKRDETSEKTADRVIDAVRNSL